MKLYANSLSGNCYKVAWMLRILGLKYELVPATAGVETQTPGFKKKNLLELDDGRYIAESNAIMLYLAETEQNKLSLIPQEDAYQRAMVYQWLFFEQYSHEPAIAVRRANLIFDRPCSTEKMQQLLDKGYRAFDVMERQLSSSSYMAGTDTMTVADMALYAYTHVADQGGYDMKNYPNIVGWMKRIQASPTYFGGMEIMEIDNTK